MLQMLDAVGDTDHVQALELQLWDAINCLHALSGEDARAQLASIEETVLDTDERALVWAQVQEALGGGIGFLPEEPPEDDCYLEFMNASEHDASPDHISGPKANWVPNPCDVSECGGPPGVIFVFANGMFNTLSEAQLSAIEMRYELQNAPTFGTLTAPKKFALAYNQNQNGLAQLIEACGQAELCDGYIATWLTQEISEDDVACHVALYENCLAQGNKIVVIPHSQGNLFTISAMSQIENIEPYDMSVFAVASPAATLPSTTPIGDHVRVQNDVVIAIVDSIADVLPHEGPNNNYQGPVDPLHHAFVDEYLWGNNSGPSITGGVIQLARRLWLEECDAWAQDCASGEKCVAIQEGLSTRCVPLVANPDQSGDVCNVVNAATGADTCDIDLLCVDGVCVSSCTGSPVAPLCDNPWDVCVIQGTSHLCFRACEPGNPDAACPPGYSCSSYNGSYYCDP